MRAFVTDCTIETIYDRTGTTELLGGQQAGMPSSAIRVTHIPTGTVAQVGFNRSQHKNKMIAFEMIEWALEFPGMT